MITTAAAIGIGLVVGGGAAAAASSMRDSPNSPNYAAATRESILSDIETLPLRKMIEAAAAAGTKVEYTDPRTGEKKTADFTGMGDIDQTKVRLDFSLEAAEKVAKASIELEDKYGEQVIKQRLHELELADPEGFKTRKLMGGKVFEDLDKGTALDDETYAQVVESERAGQALRGNILGQSAGAAEAFGVGEAGLRLYQQRLANASAFLSGTTPVSQFTQISGAQGGPVAFNPVSPGAGVGLNPQAGAAGANYALNATSLGQSADAYNNAPWQSFLGSLGGVGTGLGASAADAYIGKKPATPGKP